MNYDVNNVNNNQNTNNLNASNMTPNTNSNVVPNNNVVNQQSINPGVLPQGVNNVNGVVPNTLNAQTPNTAPNVQNSQVVNNTVNNNQPVTPNNNQIVNNIAPINQTQSASKSVSTIQDKMKTILNGLFNFGNIKKIFKYSWGSIIDETLPKDIKEGIDKESYDNIFYGGILKVIADILAIIFSICMVYVIDALDPARISGLKTLGLNNDVSITVFVPIVITLIIFTYNSAIGFQKQKTTFHFAFIWLVLLSIIFSLVKLVSYIATLFISPLYAILGFISFFLSLLGDVHVIVGCVDFCKRVNHDYVVAHTVVPVQGPITTTRISVDDVSDHNSKTCPYCAAQNPKDATLCSNCSKNI